MLSAFTLTLLALASTGRQPAPVVRVRLSDRIVTRGEPVHVHVRAAADGYLLVLRADAAGRVHVLFPLDPAGHAVRGGRDTEIRGRGHRPAFTVEDREGSGMVLAAWSATPFRVEQFARDAHWDLTALAAQRDSGDAEAAMLDVVDQMAGGHYEFDVVAYTVRPERPVRRAMDWYAWSDWPSCFACDGGSGLFIGPRFGIRAVVALGWPFGRGRT